MTYVQKRCSHEKISPTIAQFAEAFGVSDTTVNNYIKRGMSRDSIESAIAWRAANVKSGPGPEAETDEEVAAIAVKMRQAELADKLESARTRKLKNDILEERLIEKKEVERDIAIAISRMTNKLNALGTRCANLCPSELKPAIKEAVENTTRVILKEMIDDLQERTPDE